MKKKSSRRSFLKSGLALSALGFTFPKPEQSRGGQIQEITVRELYERTVTSVRLNEQPKNLLEILLEAAKKTSPPGDLVAVLLERGLRLKGDCHEEVIALLNEHGKRSEITNLQKAIYENKWGLRRYGDPEKWQSPCPWVDCPPV